MRPNRHHAATLLVLVAFYLRATPLTQNRFHPDEALYATFARLIASGHDPLLATIVVDKPPLPFYLMAASMTIFGGTEFAARLPTFLASVITIAILYQLARSLYNPSTAHLAALLLAASPMAILFAITLFTDTLLATFIYLSLLCIVRRRWSAAGWAFGLAFACKQTALFFLPLIFIVGILSLQRKGFQNKNSAPFALFASSAFKFILPVILCALAIFLWDFTRHAPISFWTQGYSDNNPGRLVRSNEIWPRGWAWLDLLQYLIGSPILNTILLLGLPLLLLLNRHSRPALYDYIFTGFILTFLTGYWLLAFNVWDRYLVILTPIIALLAGRVLIVIGDWLLVVGLQFSHNFLSPVTNNQYTLLSSVFILHPSSLVLLLCLLPPALTAARSGYPIGGDHGAYDGIDEIATTLKTVPPGTVLYDHWLSWELGFYLFDGPAYIAWMPGPGTLTADLQAFGKQSPRYIVSPSWESFTEMQTAIEQAGFQTEVIQQTQRRDSSLSFTLYQIKPINP